MKETYANGYWKQKNGRIIHVSKMTDDHLKNIRALLLRIAESNIQGELNAISALGMMFTGEQASYDVDSSLDRLAQTSAEEVAMNHHFWFPLEEELHKRNIYL